MNEHWAPFTHQLKVASHQPRRKRSLSMIRILARFLLLPVLPQEERVQYLPST